MEKMRLSCPCMFGLESVLSYEIKKLGVENVETTDGRVSFDGDASDIMRANIELRTAERVQVLLGKFRAESFDELFEGVRSLAFEEFIGENDTFPVKGYSLSSKLKSVPDCQSIIKKAIVKRLEKVYGKSWFDESGAVYQIQFSILKDEVMILLDTTGEGLYKRGYRKEANAAPIKETLAAGIADLARVGADSVVMDLMCGSGTLLIESALRALDIPPGINRRFSYERWGIVSRDEVLEYRKSRLSIIRKDAQFKGLGGDIDKEAVELTVSNAKRAGVISRIRAEEKRVEEFDVTRTQSGIVICNPPYGERLLDVKGAEKLYAEMGKVFTEKEGMSYYIISPHDKFEEIFGREAKRKRKLYNGMIKCTLYMYF